MRKHLDALGIKTIGQLAETPVELMRGKFGIVGEALHRAARGLDDSPVVPTLKGIEVKSFGQSMSLGKGSKDVDYILDVLLGLCDGATRRMRKDGYAGRTVVVYICLGRLFGVSRRMSLGGYTSLPGRVFSVARGILLDMLSERAALDVYPATKVGMSVTGLIKEKECGRQVSVFDVLDEKESNLALAVDALKNKYGDKAITRCALLGLRNRYCGVARSEIGIF
jgi:DNA polymerase-4